MKIPAFLIPSLVLLVVRFSAAQETPTEGIDWRLPEEVGMAVNAGYLSWDPNWTKQRSEISRYQDGNIHLASFIYLTWAELNPEKGSYNWTLLDRRIRSATSEPGTGYVLMLVTFSKTHPRAYPNQPQRKVIPAWVEAEGPLNYLSNDAPALWEPGCAWVEPFSVFLKALADRYKDDPKLVAVAMGGLDCEHGEWCWRGKLSAGWNAADVDAVLLEAEKNTGLTPQTYETWGKQFIDSYANAFHPLERKLVWMNGSDNAIWSPSRQTGYFAATRALWQHAYQSGCGGRDGAVEVWNRYLDPGHGMRWTEEGYLEVDPEFAPIRNQSTWYTENEFFRNAWPEEELWLRWFTSSMRLLQMRRQWVAVGGNFEFLEALDPEFVRWLECSLGRTAKDAPDAWCWLREGYPAPDKPLKNYERWLYQRDRSPDGRTKPAEKVDLGQWAQFNRYVFAEDYEYHARSTDIANGQPCIYFQVDPEFAADHVGEWILAVSYFDTAGCHWEVEYDTGSGETQEVLFENGGTGELRSVRISLPGISLGKESGFRFRAAGEKDLTVKLVRLIREL